MNEPTGTGTPPPENGSEQLAAYLTATGPTTSTATTSTATGSATATGDVNVRSGPGTSYTIVGVATQGTKVATTGKLVEHVGDGGVLSPDLARDRAERRGENAGEQSGDNPADE